MLLGIGAAWLVLSVLLGVTLGRAIHRADRTELTPPSPNEPEHHEPEHHEPAHHDPEHHDPVTRPDDPDPEQRVA